MLSNISQAIHCMCSASLPQTFKMFMAFMLLLFTWTAQGKSVQVNSTNIQPQDCQDLIQQGNTYEGHYVVYDESTAFPNNPNMIYCSQDDGMKPLPSDREPARNCLDLLQDGLVNSGINVIYPHLDHPTDPVLVFCDQETDGGGWTVIQKRYDGSEDFYRPWIEYSEGFGNVAEEYYLGNDIISSLTGQSVNELRVDLEDWEGQQAYAHYQAFYLDAQRDYRMQVFSYDGTAGDSLDPSSSGRPFTTFDADHDLNNRNCAEIHHSGWWHTRWCTSSNLNGRYYPGSSGVPDGMYWKSFRDDYYSLKSCKMMLRPYSCAATASHTGGLHVTQNGNDVSAVH